MEVSLDLDTKKVQKALNLSEKQMTALHKRAAKRTAQNVRVIASKGNLGIGEFRRKKVPRARVKPLNRGDKIGIWFGLNDVSASEFKGTPKKVEGGVTLRGKFYKGYFLARFKHDPNPKSVKRVLILPPGKRSWEEVRVPIEKAARAFINNEIQPKVEGLFNKNFEQAVEGQATLKWKSS